MDAYEILRASREPFTSAPYTPQREPIDHGPSIGDIHSVNDDPTRPASTVDIGDLGTGQDATPLLPEGPSGITPLLELPDPSDLPKPPSPTSAIAPEPPWQNPPNPRPYTTTTYQVWVIPT
jgi:hypothetical protein